MLAGSVLPAQAERRPAEDRHPVGRPNILFVFADQLRYGTLGCEGNSAISTPTFDRLAREGVVFDQAFSSCPICSPYRAQILTGRYAHRNGVIDNEYRLFPGQETLAHRLGKAGYRTAYFGKWHLGYGPYTAEKRHGFDDLVAYNNDSYLDITYWRNESGPHEARGFAPPHETRMLLDYVEEHRRETPDRPFCAFLSWTPPHWGHRLPREYGGYPAEYDVYDPAKLEVPHNVPAEMREFARREIADYYALTTALDGCMKEILDALEAWGIADNTIVCFSSDHGDHLSAHGFVKPYRRWAPPELRGSKFTPYEESIHVPFILRFPRSVPAGRRSNVFFNSVDVLPTLMRLCGLEPPADVQGRDLSHAVHGREGTHPDSAFFQILGPGWPNRIRTVGLWRAVRTAEFTYARWHDRDGLRMLFDREKDSIEMNNLADDAKYAVVVERMEVRLQQWLEETEDPFDIGKRLPVTNMLDLGQVFTSFDMHRRAPRDYAAAIEKYR